METEGPPGVTATVCIVDYGMGNIGSVRNAFGALGMPAIVAADRRALEAAAAIVLPGVGAFGKAMANLASLDLIGPLSEQVVERKKPFLGICLGLQLIATESFEQGHHKGLGWIDGAVVDVTSAPGLAVPHVGWSELSYAADDPAFARIARDSCFYFDHAYTLTGDPGPVIATVEYGAPIVAAIRRGNILATQFHPEKSQRNGLKLLRNFTNTMTARRAA